jgi:hypothetical protein
MMRREQGSAPIWHTCRGSRSCAILLGTASLAAASPSWAASAESGSQPSTDPEASSGFQAAASTGLTFPAGSASGTAGDRLSRRYSYQWPIGIELGIKLGPAFYLGSYFGVAIGAEGSDTRIEAYCDDDDADLENDIGCSSVSVNLGLELRYGFAPAARYNPWVSYGLGFEGTQQSLDDRPRGYSEQTFSSGPTWARLGAGFDYRSEVLGFGPYLQAAFGRFSRTSTYVNDDLTYEASVDERGWHAWLAIGTRLVLFP